MEWRRKTCCDGLDFSFPAVNRLCRGSGSLESHLCRMARYCSRDCQRETWKEHKSLCNHQQLGYEAAMKERNLTGLVELFTDW